MTQDDIIRMARDAGLEQIGFSTEDWVAWTSDLERFAALVAAAERNKLAAWMTKFGFATGHGDTMEQLCDALGTEIVDLTDCEVKAEREACADVCDQHASCEGIAQRCAVAIRARGGANGQEAQ